MNKNIWLKICFFSFFLLFTVADLSAQQNFARFWTKFKTAVMKNEKKMVADLTKFPLKDESENDEGSNPAYSRAKFLRQYNSFFNNKIKTCFQNPKFSNNNNNPSEKILSCETGRYLNMSFMFKKTKFGWKWINFNND